MATPVRAGRTWSAVIASTRYHSAGWPPSPLRDPPAAPARPLDVLRPAQLDRRLEVDAQQRRDPGVAADAAPGALGELRLCGREQIGAGQQIHERQPD